MFRNTIKNKILFSILFIFLFSLTFVSAEKVVLFAMDDFQVWWLTDIQDDIIQVHVDNQIPVTLGVIPSGITELWGEGERFSERIQGWDSYSHIEVAQHGYDHELYFEDEDYDTQYDQIKLGNDLMKSLGVSPKSFIPPFGSANSDTVDVLIELYFHTLYNPVEMNPTQDNELLIIQDQIILCRDGDEGKNCVYKDYNTLKSQIEQKLNQYDVALVLYHMQDFESSTGGFDNSKANQIVNYANQLSQEGYTLMTVEQYYQYLNEPPQNNDEDNDGYDETQDCDDSNPLINPGATEICDNIDNNCNNQIDEELGTTSCGLGICYHTINNCVNGQTQSCNPFEGAVAEICNNFIDDDCDGLIDLEDCGDCPPTIYCGDGQCNGDETCSSCPEDCGDCPIVCGDGTCNGDETCSTCPSDCGICPPTSYCGDGILDEGEQCDNGAQNGIVCSASYGNSCDYCSLTCEEETIQGSYCGDGTLQILYEECDDGNNVNNDGCSLDCEIEEPSPYCGDGQCNGDETCSTCSADCGTCPIVCGDGILDFGEECDNGAQNGIICLASYGKTCSYCSLQCQIINIQGSYCGDGTCSNGETCLTCSSDCGSCFSRIFQRFWWSRFQRR